MTWLRYLSLFLVLEYSHGGIREPWVENFESFFDRDDCNAIVEAAEAYGFSDQPDSIDYNEPRGTISWQIDIVLDGEIEVPELAALYDKYLLRIRDLVAESKVKLNNDTAEPTLDWVFLRKYSAGAERRMLKLHHDVNLFTLNVALNDDFEGGGIFYHKNHDEYFVEGSNLPRIPADRMNYDFLDDIKRENTTDLVFPHTSQGSLLIHNNTLFHAVAPIEKGTRYSLIFFYDMHHPDVKMFHQKPVEVKVINEFDFPVDLYTVDSSTHEYSHTLLMEELDDEFYFEAVGTHHYEIVRVEDGNIVFEFDVYIDREEDEEYVIVVGPEEDESIRAIIENKFDYPVSVYWITFDEEGTEERVMFEETMEDILDMNSQLGHKFIVVDKETDEIVDSFEIEEDEEGEREFRRTVGPHEQSAHEGEL